MLLTKTSLRHPIITDTRSQKNLKTQSQVNGVKDFSFNKGFS